MADAEGAVLPAPPGIQPIWIQQKNYDKYNLYVKDRAAEEGGAADAKGSGRAGAPELVQLVYINKKNLLEDIAKFGFMNDFFDFQKLVAQAPGEDILLLADPQKLYGEAWNFPYTAEALETALAQISEAARQAEEVAQSENADRKRAQEEAEEGRSPVYEDKPVVARLWKSSTMADTESEVKLLEIIQERPCMTLTMTRPLKSFGTACSFADRDAVDHLSEEYMMRVGIRKYMEAAFVPYDPANPDKKLVETGCQAAPISKSAHSQTSWNRPVNMGVQYEAVKEKDVQAMAKEVTSPAMLTFLRRVRPLIEEALQQNETVDIFADAFAMSTNEDEVAIVNKTDNELRELRTFTDLQHSKNKAIVTIDWLPRRKGMVAVSAVNNLTFDQRVEASGLVLSSSVLIWDFADLIHPILNLEAPHEVFCFSFNPVNGTQVVGGTLSGQVVLWDVAEVMGTIERRKKKQSSRHVNKAAGASVAAGEDPDDADKKAIPPQKPTAVSHIDLSHRRLVADLAWLPPHIQMNYRGLLLGSEHLDDKTHQFVTVAGDGQCLVWDTRFQQIAEGLLPWVAKPRQSDKKREDKGGLPPRAPWVPLFRMQLSRPEGVGELALCRVILNFLDTKQQAGGTTAEHPVDKKAAAKDPTQVDRRSHIICATEDGDIVYADWQSKSIAGPGAGAVGDEEVKGGEEGGDMAPEFVKWVAKDHTRPCVGLMASPFFPGVFLSVGDWSFSLWNVDGFGRSQLQMPIFCSPMSSTYLTSARWSPTRPALLFLGKADGSIDAWDFTDSSYSPSVTMMSSPSRITSMEFLKPESPAAAKKLKQQLLSVGDAVGNLHVFDVPLNLWRSLPNEKSIMRSFLRREEERVKYFTTRMELRTQEAAAMEAEELHVAIGAADSMAGGGGGGGGSGEGEGGGDGAGVGEGGESSERIAEEAAALGEAEKVYKALEASFIERMGLSAKDLEHYMHQE